MSEIEAEYTSVYKDIEYNSHGNPKELRCVVCGQYHHSMDVFPVDNEQPLGVCLYCVGDIVKEWFEEISENGK